ncbi:aprataxin-like protein isoform X2 [Hermetia illucens]|nr:aprataxin-like protein isoform X2 [Hermetia illucens]XP_037922603.1 aprataxin-like protein isoform X2 [Hermetia illucens]XP_037922604.1 aprataxin-like protein isoform X2 [Hermetia illucens]
MTILKASEPYILTFLYRMMSSAKKSSWNMGLVNSMHDPALLFISTDLGVVIRDKYPKARHHFLVLPKSDIPSIYHVKRKDLSLLYELHLLAVNVIEILGMKTDDFKIGFHALPSMQRLHLHVISTDFISSCLKTKKHWNSFNTELFLDYEYVRNEIEVNGSLRRIDKQKASELSAKELKCNQCNHVASNMPNLKSHLLVHSKR